MLVNGTWQGDFKPADKTDARGGFVRESAQFRAWVGDPAHAAARDRDHLYVALTCPRASRILALRRLYEHPDIRPTVDFAHIRTGYYSIRALNPSRIVPRGPETILGGIRPDG